MLHQPQILSLAAAASATAVCALYGTFVPNSSLWGKVIWRATNVSWPLVSLTFDDGPTRGCTDQVLDLLKQLDVKATFFVIGRNVEQYPDLLQRMDAEGHLVANHTFDHGHFDLFRGWRYWNAQVARTNDLITGIIGKTPALFRPAMGITTVPIHHAAKAAGQAVVTWSRRARDGVRVDPTRIVRRIMRATGPGDILMLHDGIDPHLRKTCDRDRSATVAAIEPLIAALRKQNLTPVRLDELLNIPGYTDVARPTASVARTAT